MTPCRAAAAAIAVAASAGAAWALDAELRRLAKDADPDRRCEAARSLGRDGSPDAARVLVELLADRSPFVRDAAVVACESVGDDASVAVLASAAKSKEELTRRNCAEALGRTRNAAALAALETLAAKDASPQVRADALDALWHFAGSPKAAEIATSALHDGDPFVRAAAVEAVGRVDGGAASDVVKTALADADEGVRCVARMELRAVDPAAALAGLATAATDPSWRVRAQCVDDAAALRARQAMDVLVELVGDRSTRVAASAHRALQTLTGRDIGRDRELWDAWWTTNRGSWTAASALDAEARDDPARTTVRYHGLDVATDAAVFVADLSGSMKEPSGGADGRTRWAAAAAELRRTFAALPDAFTANLVFFQDETHAALPRPQPLTRAARDKLEAFIAGGSPGHEGDLRAGVLAALAEDATNTVFLLSDGSPSAGDLVDRARVRAAIRQRNRTRKCVIETIGFGTRRAAERGLLEGIARDSGGRFAFRGEGGK